MDVISETRNDDGTLMTMQENYLTNQTGNVSIATGNEASVISESMRISHTQIASLQIQIPKLDFSSFTPYMKQESNQAKSYPQPKDELTNAGDSEPSPESSFTESDIQQRSVDDDNDARV